MSFKFNIKKHGDAFYVRMRSYADADKAKYGKENSEYVELMLPKHEWAAFGFKLEMTIEQARKHALSLNAQTRLEDSKERRAKINHQIQSEHKELVKTAYLPEQIVKDFEKKLEGDSYSDNFKEDSKIYYHWRTAKRIIASLDMPPSEWAENNRQVLKKMEGLAPSTITRQIHLINAYGVFYSKKMGKFFEKVAKPKGAEIGRISDKYLDKTGGRTKEAKGVTLKLMSKIAHTNELTQEEKNWCVVCLGLGLRPVEVKEVAKRDSKTLTILKSSVKIYQSKLVSLPRNLRFKEVTIKHPFQKDAYNIIKSNDELVAPSVYKLRKILGDGYGLYSFRKGYTEIMITLGEPIERISSDLGHSSIERTWKSYRKRISAN